MRIILTENDIKKALIAYTSTLGLDLSNHQVDIELTAGRGANGHSATVIIDEADDTKNVKNPVDNRPQASVPPQSNDTSEEEVEIPTRTPETAGHESEKAPSLFGD